MRRICLVTLLILLSTPLVASALDLTLAGESAYVIALCEDPIASEATAARELQAFLEQVTGVRVPIQTSGEEAEKAIVIGAGKRLKAAFPALDLAALGHDGIVMKSLGETLFLAGGRPRGALYAVYTFLEEIVGCRWWTATESFIPKHPSLSIPTLDRVYTPKLAYREAFYRNALADGVFTSRMKCNGHFARCTSDYGNHYSIIGWCHTFYQFLPPEAYFEEHPEWYSEISGKRKAQHAQLCLTNLEMRKVFIEQVLARIADQPEAGIISVSQNDCHGACQCAACKALAEKEGSEAGPLLHFVNAVAEAVEVAYPGTLVETLAYQYTRKAPKFVRPRKNVIVRLCSIECCFAQPLSSGEQNLSFREDIESWSPIAHQLYIWNYVTNFRNYILPHPNMRVLSPNLRYFVDHKAIGLFEQGDSMCSISDFPELRPWILAHLMWDPSLDIEVLTKEFMEGYYGQAAAPLLEYIRLIHDCVEAAGTCLRCYMEDTSAWFPLSAVNRATQLFEAAEKSVGEDAVLLKRVRRARMPLDHVWLTEWNRLKRAADQEALDFLGPKDPKIFCQDFIAHAKDFKAAYYAEGRPFDDYALRLQRRFRDPAPAPEACAALDSAKWIDIQDNLFRYHGEGRLSEMVEDSIASDAMAGRMPGSHHEWAIQYPIAAELADLGNVALYAVLRVDLKEGARGSACTLGIYDDAENKNLAQQTLSIESLKQGVYTPVLLGTLSLDQDSYVWIAPTKNSLVKAIYVDRIYAIAE